MNFRSNSEMARYYIEKLMEDGEEHSFPEITDYVMANSEGREIKGPLTIPIISNSVMKVICQGKGFYETTRRGCYRKLDAQVNGRGASLRAYTRAMKILQTTKAELKSCFKISLMDTEIDVEAVKDMQKCGKTIGSWVELAQQEVETRLLKIQSMETEEETEDPDMTLNM